MNSLEQGKKIIKDKIPLIPKNLKAVHLKLL